MGSDMRGGRPGRDVLMPLASLALRVAAMGLCAAALTVAIGTASDAVLPGAGSLAQTFDRLGASVAAGLVLGAALGGVLCHGFGRSTYSAVERTAFAVVAAVPQLVLAGVVMVAW